MNAVASDFPKSALLRVNALQMLTGNSVYALCQLLAIFILAVLGGPASVGQYALGTAMAMPFVFLSQMSLRQVLLNDVSSEFSFYAYRRLRVLSAFLAFVLILSTVALIGYRNGELLIIACIALGRCIESVTDIHYARLQKVGRLNVVARLMSYTALLTLALVSSLFYFTRSVEVASLTFAFGSTVALAVAQRAARQAVKDSEQQPGSRSIFALARKSWPIGAAQFFVSVNANMPRYVAEHLGGAAMLGQYSVVEQFVVAGALVVNSVGQASAPELARAYVLQDNKRFRSIVARLATFALILGGVGVVCAVFAGQTIVALVYGDRFEAAGSLFAPLMAAAVLSYFASAMGYSFTATARYQVLLINSIATAAVAGIGAYFAAQEFGLVGVAIGIALGSVTSAALSTFGLKSALSAQ